MTNPKCSASPAPGRVRVHYIWTPVDSSEAADRRRSFRYWRLAALESNAATAKRLPHRLVEKTLRHHTFSRRRLEPILRRIPAGHLIFANLPKSGASDRPAANAIPFEPVKLRDLEGLISLVTMNLEAQAAGTNRPRQAGRARDANSRDRFQPSAGWLRIAALLLISTGLASSRLTEMGNVLMAVGFLLQLIAYKVEPPHRPRLLPVARLSGSQAVLKAVEPAAYGIAAVFFLLWFAYSIWIKAYSTRTLIAIAAVFLLLALGGLWPLFYRVCWWLVPGGLVRETTALWCRQPHLSLLTPANTPIVIDARSGTGFVLDGGCVRRFDCDGDVSWAVAAAWISRARRPTMDELRTLLGGA